MMFSPIFNKIKEWIEYAGEGLGMGRGNKFEFWIDLKSWALPLAVNCVEVTGVLPGGIIESDYGYGISILCFHFAIITRSEGK